MNLAAAAIDCQDSNGGCFSELFLSDCHGGAKDFVASGDKILVNLHVMYKITKVLTIKN